MKLDKSQLAHEYALKMIEQGYLSRVSREHIAFTCFELADAMQAEADKRVVSGVPELLTKNKDGSCMHIHTTLNGGECFDCGEDLIPSDSRELEWQPDWSFSPIWAEWCAFDDDRQISFFQNEPTIGTILDVWNNGNGGEYVVCGQFNGNGDWKDSLRKRPEGKQ